LRDLQIQLEPLEAEISVKNEDPKIKKRTKITLRTKIILTIVGLLALTGVFYAANPTQFATVPLATGVAAGPADLLVTEFCTQNLDTVDCQGNFSLLATIPGPPPVGPCQEKYLAMAPSQSAAAGFTPRDVFVTQGAEVYKATPPGPLALFATIPCNVTDHTGITFDHVGTFGFNMIVTCETGGVFQIDRTGTVTPIADTGAHLEGPAVAPLSFGRFGGQILAADEFINQVHAIKNDGTVTLNVFSKFGAEGVVVIPSAPCTFCSGGAFFQAIQNVNAIYQYPLADFTGLGGSILVTSELGAGTDLITFDGTNYVQSFFDNISGLFEGSSFVDCDVPTPTPTPTPFTPTPAPSPSPTATFTPTPTATPTATATATFTPTPTPIATATATPTPTPTPTPTATSALIAYFNFQDAIIGGRPDFTSDSPPAFLGETTVIGTNINSNALTTDTPGLSLNRWPTDPDPNSLALGIGRTGENNPGNLDIPLPTSQGSFQDMTVSFAIDAKGNGYTRATLFYSIDGGVNFTNSGNSATIPSRTRGGPILVTLPVPTAANNIPDLVVRIQFTGGRSGRASVSNEIDNIRVEGTIVP
jgi:hypothetical protein